MVQFNLLPDVKIEFYRTQRTKKVVYNLAFLVSIIAVGLVVLGFFIVNIAQKKLLSDADKNISRYSDELRSIPDIEKILTIQNQLKSLPDLHQKKHLTSRLFTYLPQVTPVNVNISKINVDIAANSMTIDGTADKVESVNRFVDTLKFTVVTSTQDSSNQPAFNTVILEEIGRDAKNATYSVRVEYNTILFNATRTVSLIVPKADTSRSVTEKPGSTPLFTGETAPQTEEEKKQGQ